MPDRFTLMLVGVVIAASLFPCEGAAATVFGGITSVAIGLLFFMHGAKLSREDIKAGVTHWRLHLLVFTCTFGMFPVLGIALRPVLEPLVTPELYVGILFLCALPATVQSAIAFTAMARGNVPAAVCSASASSLIGIFLTPVLVGLLLAHHGAGGSVLDAMRAIVLQLLVPFVAGQIARRWIGGWVAAHRASLGWIDRSSILLVVYTAFSEAVIEGLWRQMPLRSLLGLVVACSVLLAFALFITTFAARRLGFSREDEITIVFCGSKKSMASGIPMAQVLFASHAVGAVVLPLMLFHQIQLMVCAVLAQRYARRAGLEPHRVLGTAAEPRVELAAEPAANATPDSASGARLAERRQ